MARILVVENDVLLLEAIRDTLELGGYSVCGAADGLQAMEAFSRFRPEVIVVEVAMPEMDGFELYRRIRRKSPNTAIPFVFISTRDVAQAVEQVTRNNGVCFLRKPFGPEVLLETVRKFLEGRESTPSSVALFPAGASTTESGHL